PTGEFTGHDMSAHAIRNQYRHYRTLIVLVLAMTVGTSMLFWLARFSPITPLRSTASTTRAWTQISVRAESSGARAGFFHYRIDETGRLFESYAWQAGQSERSAPKTVQILLTCSAPEAPVNADQAKTLAHVISSLQKRFEIAGDRIFVEAAKGVADRGSANPRLRRT
ncbi:MAG TPA: hypothetical protein VNT79_16890, partial [Phycisphaerae bacterium]|nr:hypothetical protein [Phycisphaerae bacterium]